MVIEEQEVYSEFSPMGGCRMVGHRHIDLFMLFEALTYEGATQQGKSMEETRGEVQLI